MKGFLFITFFIKAVYNTALHGEFELNREKITMLVIPTVPELKIRFYGEIE